LLCNYNAGVVDFYNASLQRKIEVSWRCKYPSVVAVQFRHCVDQSDLRFMKKSPNFVKKIAQNGALINKNFSNKISGKN
jgi:hypothetical protein